MSHLRISKETKRRVDLLFPPEQRGEVEHLLVTKCGNNLPSLEPLSEIELERFQFAALKLSGGNIDRLNTAVNLANVDWRDLLMGAGFGMDLNAHKSWLAK